MFQQYQFDDTDLPDSNFDRHEIVHLTKNIVVTLVKEEVSIIRSIENVDGLDVTIVIVVHIYGKIQT